MDFSFVNHPKPNDPLMFVLWFDTLTVFYTVQCLRNLTESMGMALVSISEAARLAGCTRSNLYKTYIQGGKLTVTHDHQGKPKVDTAELLRVFGSLQGDSQPGNEVGQNLTPVSVQQDTARDTLIEMLRQQLQEAKEEAAEREQWYRQQIGELTSTIKQLEYKPPAPFWRNWFK